MKFLDSPTTSSFISVAQQPKISVGFLRLSAANSAKKIFSHLVKYVVKCQYLLQSVKPRNCEKRRRCGAAMK
jgi:hypothetical protein